YLSWTFHLIESSWPEKNGDNHRSRRTRPGGPNRSTHAITPPMRYAFLPRGIAADDESRGEIPPRRRQRGISLNGFKGNDPQLFLGSRLTNWSFRPACQQSVVYSDPNLTTFPGAAALLVARS